MQPSRAVFNQQATLLAADTTTLGAVAGVHLHLAAAPFTPSLDLAIGSLVEATFPGYAAAASGPGPQPHYYDAVTGHLTIVVAEPLGGFKFVCTGDPTTPQTISGIYVTDVAGAVLLGSALLSPPVTISKSGQGFDAGDVSFEFLPTSPN